MATEQWPVRTRRVAHYRRPGGTGYDLDSSTSRVSRYRGFEVGDDEASDRGPSSNLRPADLGEMMRLTARSATRPLAAGRGAGSSRPASELAPARRTPATQHLRAVLLGVPRVLLPPGRLLPTPTFVTARRSSSSSRLLGADRS
jgi:hypothetical protein